MSGTGGSGGVAGSGGASGSGGVVDARLDMGSGGMSGSGGSGGMVDAPVERVDVGVDMPIDMGPSPGCMRSNWTIAANTLCTTGGACGGLGADMKEPRFAIDGNIATRYTSGVPQGTPSADETVTLTFSQTVTITGIRLQTTAVGDGPAMYRVEYSTNGTVFTNFNPQVTGVGSDDLTINFPATAMRAVRIVQTGAKAVPWWSIHELTILGCN